MRRERHGPPRLARRLLERTVPAGAARDGLVGDLHEFYVERLSRHGRVRADVWYWLECVSAAGRYVLASGRRRGDGGIAAGAAAGAGEGKAGPGGRRVGRAAALFRSELGPAATRLVRSPGFAAAAILPLGLDSRPRS